MGIYPYTMPNLRGAFLLLLGKVLSFRIFCLAWFASAP